MHDFARRQLDSQAAIFPDWLRSLIAPLGLVAFLSRGQILKSDGKCEYQLYLYSFSQKCLQTKNLISLKKKKHQTLPVKFTALLYAHNGDCGMCSEETR